MFADPKDQKIKPFSEVLRKVIIILQNEQQTKETAKEEVTQTIAVEFPNIGIRSSGKSSKPSSPIALPKVLPTLSEVVKNFYWLEQWLQLAAPLLELDGYTGSRILDDQEAQDEIRQNPTADIIYLTPVGELTLGIQLKNGRFQVIRLSLLPPADTDCTPEVIIKQLLTLLISIYKEHHPQSRKIIFYSHILQFFNFTKTLPTHLAEHYHALNNIQKLSDLDFHVQALTIGFSKSPNGAMWVALVEAYKNVSPYINFPKCFTKQYPEISFFQGNEFIFQCYSKVIESRIYDSAYWISLAKLYDRDFQTHALAALPPQHAIVEKLNKEEVLVYCYAQAIALNQAEQLVNKDIHLLLEKQTNNCHFWYTLGNLIAKNPEVFTTLSFISTHATLKKCDRKNAIAYCYLKGIALDPENKNEHVFTLFLMSKQEENKQPNYWLALATLFSKKLMSLCSLPFISIHPELKKLQSAQVTLFCFIQAAECCPYDSNDWRNFSDQLRELSNRNPESNENTLAKIFGDLPPLFENFKDLPLTQARLYCSLKARGNDHYDSSYWIDLADFIKTHPSKTQLYKDFFAKYPNLNELSNPDLMIAYCYFRQFAIINLEKKPINWTPLLKLIGESVYTNLKSEIKRLFGNMVTPKAMSEFEEKYQQWAEKIKATIFQIEKQLMLIERLIAFYSTRNHNPEKIEDPEFHLYFITQAFIDLDKTFTQLKHDAPALVTLAEENTDANQSINEATNYYQELFQQISGNSADKKTSITEGSPTQLLSESEITSLNQNCKKISDALKASQKKFFFENNNTTPIAAADNNTPIAHKKKTNKSQNGHNTQLKKH